jgi:hypothetical protein
VSTSTLWTNKLSFASLLNPNREIKTIKKIDLLLKKLISNMYF